MIFPGSKIAKNLLPLAAVMVVATLVSPAWAESDTEIPEPFFIEKAALETEVELAFGFDDKKTEDEYEIGLEGAKVFFDRLQVGASIPIGIRNPDEGSTQNAVGDVEFSTKYRFLDVSGDGLDFSLAGSAALPTGNRDKEIGGTGEWGLFALAGTTIETAKDLANLGVHLQFGYEQAIELSNEEKETAEALGVNRVREKELVWVWGVPSLRRSSTAGLSRHSKSWGVPSWKPSIPTRKVRSWNWAAGSGWAVLSRSSKHWPLGVAVKGPVTDRRKSDFSALFVVKYEFDRV